MQFFNLCFVATIVCLYFSYLFIRLNMMFIISLFLLKIINVLFTFDLLWMFYLVGNWTSCGPWNAEWLNVHYRSMFNLKAGLFQLLTQRAVVLPLFISSRGNRQYLVCGVGDIFIFLSSVIFSLQPEKRHQVVKTWCYDIYIVFFCL